MGIPAVHLKYVDVVGPQTLQARIDGMQEVLARKTAVVRVIAHLAMRFRGDDDAVSGGAEVLQLSREDLLGDSERIHIRGIEEIDAELESLPVDGPALFLLERPLSPGPRAESHRAQREP